MVVLPDDADPVFMATPTYDTLASFIREMAPRVVVFGVGPGETAEQCEALVERAMHEGPLQ